MELSEEYRRIRNDRTPPASGAPEAWVEAYLSLRKALGLKMRDARNILKSLCRFMRERGLTSFDRMDREKALEWLHQGSVQETSVGGRLSAARGFFKYLRSLGAARQDVWDSFTHPRPKRFVPYVFSLAELRVVLDKALHMDDPRANRSGRIQRAYYAAYHTTYACGLRVSEVCRLTLGDVNFERSVLTVRKTKFGKTRLVPFSPRTREVLSAYLDRFRLGDCPTSLESAFFINLRRSPFNPETAAAHFSTVCAAAGLYRPKRTEGNTVYGGTTTHALRHTFAVHRLLKWYEEGADVNSKLPLLATYMGHAMYRYTQRYLTVLPIFIDIAKKLFAGKFENPLRDLDK